LWAISPANAENVLILALIMVALGWMEPARLAIILATLSINFVGDALRDALEPRLRQ
jgi:hypothetical protein